MSYVVSYDETVYVMLDYTFQCKATGERKEEGGKEERKTDEKKKVGRKKLAGRRIEV